MKTITLTCKDKDAENTLDNPEKIIPVKGAAKTKAGKKNSILDDEIPAMTFRLYRIAR